ncbi:MAG: hypothetical protein QM762_13740 [Chryseolinea sp.]
MRLESELWGIKNQMTQDEIRELENFEISDLLIIGLFYLFVVIVQFGLVLPSFDWMTSKNKLTIKNVVVLGLILAIATGLSFGLFFGTMELGIKDVLESIAIGLFVFLVFFTVDFFTYIKLGGKNYGWQQNV